MADFATLLRLRLRVEAGAANHGHDAIHEFGRGAEVEVADDDACQVVDLEDCVRHVRCVGVEVKAGSATLPEVANVDKIARCQGQGLKSNLFVTFCSSPGVLSGYLRVGIDTRSLGRCGWLPGWLGLCCYAVKNQKSHGALRALCDSLDS